MDEILFEPFRIKVVEPIRMTTRAEREQYIREAGYNVFNIPADAVLIDLLTDSGTSAMSQEQWAALQAGDESYAGSRSFYDLERTARKVFQKQHVIPVHQGRAGEHLVFSVLVKPGNIVPANSHFDTTAANIADNGGEPVNLPIPEAADTRSFHPFKGNMDVARLEALLGEEASRVPFVVLTITNNTGGGQPVSLENIRKVSELCKRFNKPLLIDGCRFAENAYFIKKRERGLENYSAEEIAQKVFRHASIVTFSAKKDALANVGGLVCLDDPELTEQLKNRLIVTEGFPTYGGLAGRDMAAIAQGLREVLDESYLRYRLRTIEWMVERLDRRGVPVLVPAGGHAFYLDVAAFFPHLTVEQLPGIAIVTELYVRAGIRAVELGYVAFGRQFREAPGTQWRPDLVRFAIPRRVYTEAHAGYVVEHIAQLYEERESVKGYRFEHEAPVMRHFRSTFAPLA